MNDDLDELAIIAGEQHREFMAAQAVQSDLDLAFRLQLEEAMAASLAFQPSSTAPSQTLELDKIETEIKDRLIIEAESKKAKADLENRIHDRVLAHEILHMPEDQCRLIGDNFARPYDEGSSSSSSKIEGNSEVFRVYFKGLISEERVRSFGTSQKTVTMAGIGVAICDSRDGLIFEMKKPLDLVKDDRVSRRNVEGEALIEALNAAIALDLKRIEFYCDYHTLYQSVSGKWQPKQQKLKKFVEVVNLLRKSFTYCEASLITQKDVKFAIKLAREAITSQRKQASETSKHMLENCVICLDDKTLDQFFSIKRCNHQFCYSCMKQHVEVKLLHGVLPKCPQEGCESNLKIENCKIFLTPKLIEMMKQRLKEDSVPVTEKVYCPYPKCSVLMSKTELLKLPRFSYEDGARTCSKCDGNFCINCRVPWHKNMNCAEYKRRNPTQLVEESKLKNLAARNLWRQCIKCQHMIELAAGCYHMTCRCGYEFCYTCGAEWKNKKATCNCPLWDEENIVDTEEEDDDDVMEVNNLEHDDSSDDDYYF